MNYDDIINMKHPTSPNHPRMPMNNRAAQFAPFAALKTHVDKISEASRLTTQKRILDEDQRQILNRVLSDLLIHKKEHPFITIDYFVEDEYKEGGSYMTVRGQFKDIDEINKKVILLDKTLIPIGNIYRISSSLMKEQD
ncbi:hypothetical protein [uncultured Catenibacterium sp.]|uniref:hypothetical protein n=1 Tax=uncultured Catenibacterium sp. TaxID=286142 RepID=UPI0025CEA255|nr:hypothetical protein [uncultured Catenibacterium sp.]